jgi:hypothetical protein
MGSCGERAGGEDRGGCSNERTLVYVTFSLNRAVHASE